MPLDQPVSSTDHRVNDMRMSFGDHIEELRLRLIHALAGIGLCAVLTFTFGFKLISFLTQPLLQAQHALGYQPQTIETDPTVGFTTVYVPVSLISAAILASPWVIYQIWMFVVSGLYEHERQAVYVLTPFSATMTLLGVAFTYWVLLPVCLLFFLNFASFYPDMRPQEPGRIMGWLLKPYVDQVEPTAAPAPGPGMVFSVVRSDPAKPIEGSAWINSTEGSLKAMIDGQVKILSMGTSRLLTPLPRLGQYVRFASVMMLGVVIAFQVPVVMLVLGRTGLIDPRQIARIRRYALFACTAAAAILTPTDIFSMIILAVPLYGLFEFGLLLMRLTDPVARRT